MPRATGGVRRRLNAVLIVIALFVASAAAAATANAERAASFAIDANSGRVLHASYADEPRYPASLTKMMTLYLVFEQLEAGKLKPSTRIRISEKAAAAPPSKLDLDAGSDIALSDAVKILIAKSANDIAVAIAEHIGGTEASFAQLMTAKARQIGMANTTFRNASGLPDPGQVTTARDMVTLGLRLEDDFPQYFPLFATRQVTYAGTTYRNHNTLLGTYQGVDGIKTGYIRASGFNVVTSVKRNGRHIVAVVFGGKSAGTRNATMRSILDRTLAKASTVRTRQRAPVLVATPRPTRRPPPASSPPPAPATPPVTAASALPPWQVTAPAPASATEPAVEPVVPLRPTTIEIAQVRRVTIVETPSLRPTTAEAAPGWPPPPAPVSDGPPNLTAADPRGPGRAPSTLGAQAAQIAAHPPQDLSQRTAAAGAIPGQPQRQSSASAAMNYQLQVGAFGSDGEARRMLSSVRARTGDLLARYQDLTLPVQRDTKQLFRARFAGFDSRTATAACLDLRRQKIDCFVVPAE